MAQLAEVWNYTKGKYKESIYENGDPRSTDWPLVFYPWSSLTIFILYLTMCYVGPKIMKNKKAFKMKPILVFYNIAILLYSLHTLREMVIPARELNYSFVCQPMVYGVTPAHIRLTGGIWFFFLSKPLEFFDTLFFILRKKNTQISFLHVYHHSSVSVVMWLVIKFYAVGHMFTALALNSFVHVIMYSYYLLSLFPSLKRYLWWKKYVTILQMTQFVIIIIFSIWNLVIGCDYNKGVTCFTIVYIYSQLHLFIRFFFSAYKPKEKKPHTSSSLKNGNLDLSQADGDVVSSQDVRFRSTRK